MTSSLLIDEPPFQVQPSLAGLLGFDEAAVPQVIHYWLNCQTGTVFKEERYWVPNVLGRLQDCFFFWDRDTIGYLVAELEHSGVLKGLPPCSQERDMAVYHTVNYAALEGMASHSRIPIPPSPKTNLPLQHANANTCAPFTADIQSKGPNLYVLVAQDVAHSLSCEIPLEIQESKDQGAMKETGVACHFPKMMDKQLKERIMHDVTLYGVIMITFHLKLMEQLLLFSIDHQTRSLSIFADDDQADGLEIYRQFLAQQDQPTILEPDRATLTIPINQETINDWKDFMEMMHLKIRQILWREQKANPVIQNYLRQHPLAEV